MSLIGVGRTTGNWPVTDKRSLGARRIGEYFEVGALSDSSISQPLWKITKDVKLEDSYFHGVDKY